MSMKLKKKVRELTADDISQGVDITALKTTVGNSSSGLVKDVADAQSDITALETAIGDAESGLVKDVADIEAAIGDEETANSILGRIKALEDAQTPSQEESK